MQKWIFSRLIHHWEGKPGGMLGFSPKFEETVNFKIYGDPKSYKEYAPNQIDHVVSWLGDSGWELVTVTSTYRIHTESYTYDTTIWYFKKQKAE